MAIQTGYKIDLARVIDATASMGSAIEQLKENPLQLGERSGCTGYDAKDYPATIQDLNR